MGKHQWTRGLGFRGTEGFKSPRGDTMTVTAGLNLHGVVRKPIIWNDVSVHLYGQESTQGDVCGVHLGEICNRAVTDSVLYERCPLCKGHCPLPPLPHRPRPADTGDQRGVSAPHPFLDPEGLTAHTQNCGTGSGFPTSTQRLYMGHMEAPRRRRSGALGWT